jgi:hypothetical protein
MLDISCFNKRADLSDGLSARCRNCAADDNKKYVKLARRRTWLKRYNLNPKSWDDMFDKQGRCCAACGATDPGCYQGWHTDHIHGTKIVRGILCSSCNLAIGQLKDDPERLEKLAAYLRKVL